MPHKFVWSPSSSTAVISAGCLCLDRSLLELDHPEMVAWQMTRWVPSCNVLGSEFTPIFLGDNIGLFPLTPPVNVAEGEVDGRGVGVISRSIGLK